MIRPNRIAATALALAVTAALAGCTTFESAELQIEPGR